MHEQRALAAIRAELLRIGITPTTDRWGQLHARVASGDPTRPLALVAHTDHPGFEVVEAKGTAGRVRIRGGLQPRLPARPVAVLVHHDDGRAPFHAVPHDYVAAPGSRTRRRVTSASRREGALEPDVGGARSPGVRARG